MNHDELTYISQRVAHHVMKAANPCDGMAEVVTALYDDKISGQDMISIMCGATIFTARVVDTGIFKAGAALMPLLVLLYPDKPVEELWEIAGALLTGPEAEQPRHGMFIIIKRK